MCYLISTNLWILDLGFLRISKVYPTVTGKIQSLHLSTDSSMPGASVGDPYCRQYRIYGQSVPLGAAELWNTPLVDFWRLFYGQHRWCLWCPGWVSLGSTQFKWRVFAWTFNALNRSNERVFVLEARGRLVWLLLSLRSKGLFAYALKGYWSLLLLILGDLEENKALCLSLLAAAWHLLTSIDVGS